MWGMVVVVVVMVVVSMFVGADRWVDGVCIAVLGSMQESTAVESRQEQNARDLVNLRSSLASDLFKRYSKPTNPKAGIGTGLPLRNAYEWSKPKRKRKPLLANLRSCNTHTPVKKTSFAGNSTQMH